MLVSPIAVCIDLDGTLADTDASLSAGIVGAAAEAFRLTGVDGDSWANANKKAAAEVWSAGAEDWILGRISPLQLSTNIYARTLETVGQSARFAPDLVRAHAVAAQRGLRAYDDVEPFVRALSEHRIKIAILTNGASETQRGTLAALGLEHAVDVVLISAEIGYEKPDSRIFTEAVRRLGTTLKNTWHVGDSVQSDVMGADAAGLQAIWLNRQHNSSTVSLPESAVTVDSLSELIPFLGDRPASD